MDQTFKKHKLTKAERLWLEEAIKMPHLDARVIKVRLLGKIPVEFDGAKIDYRIWSNNSLTLIGLWLMNPKDSIFAHLDTVIKAIRAKILKAPGLDVVSAADIASSTGLAEERVEQCLYQLGQLGGFSGGSAGSAKNPHAYVSLSLTGSEGYDAYLSYKDIWSVMEHYYRQRAPARLTPVTAPLSERFLDPFAGSGAFSQPSVQTTVKPNTAFILMAIDPNKPEIEDIFVAIKETCQKFDIEAKRADEIEHSDQITDLILREIATCEYLIADLSYERPNVYYEVGYAQALKRKPILYRRTGTKLHFDLSVHNVPEYKNATQLRSLLTGRLENILGRSAKSKKA